MNAYFLEAGATIKSRRLVWELSFDVLKSSVSVVTGSVMYVATRQLAERAVEFLKGKGFEKACLMVVINCGAVVSDDDVGPLRWIRAVATYLPPIEVDPTYVWVKSADSSVALQWYREHGFLKAEIVEPS